MCKFFYCFSHDLDIEEIEDTREFNLEFIDTRKSKSQNSDSSQIMPNCLWKIIGKNIFKGGVVEWNTPIRLRHLASGKYLFVDLIETEENEEVNKKKN
jgi:MIR domain